MSNTKIIENLNKALQMEMSAAHQYQLHAHVLGSCGYVASGRKFFPAVGWWVEVNLVTSQMGKTTEESNGKSFSTVGENTGK